MLIDFTESPGGQKRAPVSREWSQEQHQPCTDTLSPEVRLLLRSTRPITSLQSMIIFSHSNLLEAPSSQAHCVRASSSISSINLLPSFANMSRRCGRCAAAHKGFRQFNASERCWATSAGMKKTQATMKMIKNGCAAWQRETCRGAADLESCSECELGGGDQPLVGAQEFSS